MTWPIRIVSIGHAVFAATLLALGVLGVLDARFAAVWQGIPDGVPARVLLAYLCSGVYLACGLGLLFPRAASAAARALFVWLLLWMLAFKVPFIITAPLTEVSYQSCGESVVLLAGAWVLYAALATEWDKRHWDFAIGRRGLSAARVLYALALIAFGLSHFVYLDNTAPLVPRWLPGHVFWAYFTGASYLAAAAALLSGVRARLAAALSALQMGGFTLLVWPPLLASRATQFQWTEFVVSWALTAAAWMVADSYRVARVRVDAAYAAQPQVPRA